MTEDAGKNWQERAVDRVLKDYQSGREHLRPFHDECLDRYQHYRSPMVERDMREYVDTKKPKFAVPFTTEQVNTLKARIMQKLFFRNRPCSIYGREKTDKDDAEAKKDLFDYQDRIDRIESKVDKAIMWCAIGGFVPAQVTFKKEFGTEIVNMQQPITGPEGMPIYNPDGTPMTVDVPQEVDIPRYLGSHVEIIDIFDFFFTPEKTDVDDGEPFIVRSRRRPRYFQTKEYFFNQSQIRQKEGGGGTDADKLEERKQILGLEPGEGYFKDHCLYLEWQGYFEPGDDAVDAGGNPFPPGYYVIGVVTGATYEDVLVRFDYKPFPFDGSNIIVGCLIEELGEVIGPRFVDLFHGIQHAQDSIMGLWFASLKQLVKRPKVVNSDALKNPNQLNTNIDETIEVEDRNDVDKVVRYIDVPNISPDLYNGLSMLRLMGQNSTKIHDIIQGRAQAGVETLGEAGILANEAEVGINDYIRTFERTFIQPMYEKRNAINAAYLNNEYVISVVGEKGLAWRRLTPAQIRAEVDFICEAATRENQRGVIAQQIIQLVQPMMNLMTLYANMGYPPQMWPRVDSLLSELCDVWTWGSDKIAKILPSTALDAQQEMQLAQMLQEMAMMKMMAGQPAANQGQQGPMPGSARTPQPRTEGEARRSANDRNDTHVARMQ